MTSTYAKHHGGQQAARTRVWRETADIEARYGTGTQPAPVISTGIINPIDIERIKKMAFNPQEHITKIQGREYLEVKWREVWFRDKYPEGSIVTEIVGMGEIYAIRATVSTGDRVLATGMATIRSGEKQVWKDRDIEKAETAAIGRALAHAGFGTQFTGEDEGEFLADSPVDKPQAATIDYEALYEVSAFLYSNGKHQENSIKKMIADGILTPDMSINKMMAIMLMHRAQSDLHLEPEDLATRLNMKLSEWLQAGKSPESAWETLKGLPEDEGVPF